MGHFTDTYNLAQFRRGCFIIIQNQTDFSIIQYTLFISEDLMWSKLDSGRLPSLSEVMSMVTDQIHDIPTTDTVQFVPSTS